MAASARQSWVPYAAAAAGAVMSLKAVLVVATDDGAPGAAGALYLLGLLLGLVAAVGAGLRQRGAARGVAVGLGAALLLVLWVMGLGETLESVVAAVTDDEHAPVEAPILLAGLVLLGLAWRARARDLQVEEPQPAPLS